MPQVARLASQPNVALALEHGGTGDAWATNTMAIVFLAGTIPSYRKLATTWKRVRRCGTPRRAFSTDAVVAAARLAQPWGSCAAQQLLRGVAATRQRRAGGRAML